MRRWLKLDVSRKVIMKNLEEKLVDGELNGMILLRELKRSKKVVLQIECENKLLRKTTERRVDSVIRKALTSSGFVEQRLKAPGR